MMRILVLLSIVVCGSIVFTGCKKATEPQLETETVAESQVSEQTVEQQPDPVSQAEPIEKKIEIKLESIPLELPMPMFVGTPENLSGVKNLEKPLGKQN